MSHATHTFRACSYNIHSCVGRDRRASPERVLHVLREIDADIVALQEVGDNELVEGMEQFVFFEKHLAMAGIHGINLRRGRHAFGNAVFVRGQVERFRMEDLSVTFFEPRGAIDCSVRVGDYAIRVVATHLGLYPYERREQVDRLSRALTRDTADLTVVLGDFNIFGLERRILRRAGAPKRLPTLRTFPARRPLMSLDRIWTLPNRHLMQLHVHRTPLARMASDHLPIVADIAWPDQPARELKAVVGA